MVTVPAGGFLFLRHGETEANAHEIICGKTDLPLNDTGVAQAGQAAEFLRDTHLARIVASPLLRARQTAKAVATRLRLPVMVIDGLAEQDWGEWEGQPRSRLRREATPPGGESPQAFETRTRAAFDGIDLGEATLIVAHSGTDRVLHAILGSGQHRRMGNAELRLWAPAMRGTRWICHECFKPDS